MSSVNNVGAVEGWNEIEPRPEATGGAAPTPNASQKTEDEEGFAAFVKGAVAGDFDSNDSWSAIAGKIVGGLNPLADARDIAAGVVHVARGEEGAWFDLGASVLGAVPLVGDAGKALLKGGRKVAEQAAEQAVGRAAKQGAEAAAENTANQGAEMVSRPLGAKGAVPRVPDQFGTHAGAASGRPFFPDEVGVPIRDLAGRGARVTPRGIDVVEKHLSRFGADAQNAAQLRRLRDISAGRIEATRADINFYVHELREYVRYRKLGYETGVPADSDEAMRLWNNTHTATLEDYGLKEGRGVLYDTSTYPELKQEKP